MIHDKEFEDVLKDAYDKFVSKKSKYGESWKHVSIKELTNKFVEEYTEWNTSDEDKEEYKELLDIINVALMLATRISQSLTKVKKK